MAVRTDYNLLCPALRAYANLMAPNRLMGETINDAADTIEALAAAPKVEMAVEGPFNKATVYRNCAVQVCENTKTGASSVAWTQNPEIIEKWEAEQYETEGSDE